MIRPRKEHPNERCMERMGVIQSCYVLNDKEMRKIPPWVRANVNMSNPQQIEIKGAASIASGIDVIIPQRSRLSPASLAREIPAFDALYARDSGATWALFRPPVLRADGQAECDSIKGIPPAIAIEQRVNTVMHSR